MMKYFEIEFLTVDSILDTAFVRARTVEDALSIVSGYLDFDRVVSYSYSEAECV